MSQQIIDTSTETDTLAAGLAKANSNFTELYSSLMSTGMMIDYWGLYEPDGWIFAAGGTIGNASSGADYTNNTEDLFLLLWGSIGDAYCPVSGGRGASAAADFAANKTLTLPDVRGKATILAGGSFTALGSSTGSETATLIAGNMPSHNHDVVIPAHNHSINIPTSSVAVQNGADSDVFLFSTSSQNTSSTTEDTITSSSEGSGSSFSIMQPSIVCHKIIKL